MKSSDKLSKSLVVAALTCLVLAVKSFGTRQKKLSNNTQLLLTEKKQFDIFIENWKDKVSCE